jgi:hypothetical protein
MEEEPVHEDDMAAAEARMEAEELLRDARSAAQRATIAIAILEANRTDNPARAHAALGRARGHAREVVLLLDRYVEAELELVRDDAVADREGAS